MKGLIQVQMKCVVLWCRLEAKETKWLYGQEMYTRWMTSCTLGKCGQNYGFRAIVDLFCLISHRRTYKERLGLHLGGRCSLVYQVSLSIMLIVNTVETFLDGRFTVEHEVNSEEVGWAHEN